MKAGCEISLSRSGNAPHGDDIVSALASRIDHPSEIVREHVRWALDEQSEKTRTQ